MARPGPSETRTQGGGVAALLTRLRTQYRAVSGAASVAVVLGVGASLLATPAYAAEPPCPNEARRSEQGERTLALPDCRAYELVSPLGSEPEEFPEHITPVSSTGDRIGWYTQFGPAPGSTDPGAGAYYLSARDPEGWTTVDEIPPQSTNSGLFCGGRIEGYSRDLSSAILADGLNWTGYPAHWDTSGTTPINCGHDEPLLVPGEGQGAQNLFLHASDAPNEAGFYQLLNPTPPGSEARDAYFQAGSADLSHVVFTSPLQLTPEAPLPPERPAPGGHSVGEDLYERFDGTVHLVTILPNGVADWGILANGWQSEEASESAGFTNAVSEDGERVFFYGGGASAGAEGAYLGASLYLRENAAREPAAGGGCTEVEVGRACTVQLDEPNSDAPPGPGGGGIFQWATPDGSRAFFTDCARLTADATAVSSSGGCGGFAKTDERSYEQPRGNDLYEWDGEKPAGHRLTDLTVDPNGTDALRADVQGVAGISHDGSYVYFVARGVLTGGEENARHERATGGEANLYLRHAGTTAFIAILGPPIPDEVAHSGVREQVEACDWASAKTPESGPPLNPAGAPNPCLTSRVSSDGRFLAFDSHRSLTGYDNTVTSTGEPSVEIFRYDAASKELECASCAPAGDPPTAAKTFEQPSILSLLLTGERWNLGGQVLSSQLADDGQVFFSTTDPLLPADTNGESDVYEYDDGALHLISAGTGGDISLFRNASPDGSNVFFTTADALLGRDTDGATSIYDARVGGGFPEPPPPVACESEEACHTAHQAPPTASTPATVHFQGPGNEVRCPKGKVKKSGKCVSRHSKKHHSKKHKSSHKRAANTNRRAGK